MPPRFCSYTLFSTGLVIAAVSESDGAEPKAAIEAKTTAGVKTPAETPAVAPTVNSSPERPAAASGQISATTSKAIRAGLPTFTPPKTADPTPDDVVVLSKVEVFEKKLRLPSSTDVLTKAGREELLRKKYPHATSLMLEEVQRLENMKDLNDIVDTLSTVGRKSDSKELRREVRDAFMRRTNPRDEALDKIYNRGHR
jgi:hypothetical protein